MDPVYNDGQATFWLGDCREVLRSMPDESVQCVVTSPPYWSLRDYGVEPTVWGGDADCAHDWGETVDGHPAELPAGNCRVCGAWLGALGLEPTPELFVAHTVEVFREVRRVLAKDGTLWLNLGDSYAGSWGAQSRGNTTGEGKSTLEGTSMLSARQISEHPQFGHRTGSIPLESGLKPKDLVGIPWMVAFALRADGWWLRQDIIWSKPNPMPESVRDRCTKAHEYLFLLCKSERYVYDQDAIAEAVANPLDNTPSDRARAFSSKRVGVPAGQQEPFSEAREYSADSRNKRSVWTVPTAPYPEAHFATFPPALVKPAILAGCPEGGIVLDPFLGSGTTAMVAKSLGRKAWGIDANAEYLELAKKRCAQMGLMLE